nr:hypothetical protein CFP56_46860 [Quercus suber]
MATSSLQLLADPKGAINLEGKIREIRAKPTRVMGWCDRKVKYIWKLIILVTTDSVRIGFLPFANPARGLMLPQISRLLILCEENQVKALSERRTLEVQPISTTIMGNHHNTKITQVLKPTLEFCFHAMVRELNLDVPKHMLTLCPGKGRQSRCWW